MKLFITKHLSSEQQRSHFYYFRFSVCGITSHPIDKHATARDHNSNKTEIILGAFTQARLSLIHCSNFMAFVPLGPFHVALPICL